MRGKLRHPWILTDWREDREENLGIYDRRNMTGRDRLRSSPSSKSTERYVADYLKSFSTLKGETLLPSGVEKSFKGLKCLEKLPLYKALADAVLERNNCERLHTETENKLRVLDSKVQAKLSAIVNHKKERKKLKLKVDLLR